ncbi:hypothetical protein HIM_06832 [Hirsutella minnesotensis 3608]|uniref:Zn(2)-C6 fungal-type domain-containing protein n=1 Tax=Hirsutella minnesotensis 3608 TaxID=1043627 RepID=A0A0F8A4K0_9HYPO|nr:hypothetical protein HIM_06832 [Hirsutella minnesotensis 3608]
MSVDEESTSGDVIQKPPRPATTPQGASPERRLCHSPLRGASSPPWAFPAHTHTHVSYAATGRRATAMRRGGHSALGRAPKGKNPSCSTCTKRRIVCDLGRPACKKCKKKGLECPGYGPRLRWAGGVAVRGRFKGQNVPIADAGDEGPQSLSQGTGTDEQSEAVGNGRAAAQGEQPNAAGVPNIGPGAAPPVRPGQERRSPEPFNHSKEKTTAEAPSPDLTLRKSARAFIEYYDKNIAGLMVWFDTADNDYRRRVLPLAANTPGLRLAVAAISAYHGGMTFDHAVPRFSEAARDACLGLIQSRVRDMTGRLTGGAALTTDADLADAEWMLAAILMISTYEMANAQAAAAESHRMAARTIVNVFGHAASARGARVFDFLRNQVAVLDVLSSTTSFDRADVEGAVLPPASMADGLFTRFLSALHHVTLVSRRRDAESSSGQGAMTAAEVDASVEDATLCAQNLPWPAFVAGTECHGDPRRQEDVAALLTLIAEATGFRHFLDVNRFLRMFWAGDDPDWRPLARLLQQKGFRILAV